MFRSLVLLLVLLALPRLVGCDGEAQADRRVMLRFSIWGSFEEWEMWRQVVRAFEREHPDIRVKLLYWPAAYEDKLKVLLAANRAPDVMEMQDEPFQMYATKGRFEDLTSYLAAEGAEYASDRFLPTSLEVFRFNRTGRQLGLPWDGGGIIVYYNRELFRRSGVPEPDANWTWATFLRTCRRLTHDLDGDGRIDQFGLELQSWWGYLEMFVWGRGGRFFDAENTHRGGMNRASPIRCVLDEAPVISGFQFYRDLRFRHHVAPTPTEAAGRDQEVLFLTRRIAMRFNGPWGMPLLRQARGIDWDVAPMPIAPTGQRVTRCSWDGVTMSRASRNKPEAWALIKFITGVRGQTIIARSARGVPARASVARSPAFIDPDTPQHEEHFVDAVSYQRIQPITEIWTEMDPIMQRETDKLLLGKQDAATTGRAMARDINRLIEQRGLGEVTR